MQTSKYSIPTKKNLLFMICLTTANLFAMFYLPLLLLPKNMWWALLLIPVIFCTNSYWSLIHESIHYIFSSNKKINTATGRIMSIVFGTVFQIVQFSHLMHHAYNRTSVDRPEVYEAEQHSYFARAILYYFKLIIGLYFLEFFGPALMFLPQQVIVKMTDKIYRATPQIDKMIKNRLLSSASLQVIRFDATLMYLLFAITFFCYAHYWWLWLLAMFGRGFMISVTDNLPHYATKVDQVRYAHNLALPIWLEKFIFNFNLHRTHHEYPNIPWTGLPIIMRQANDHCDISYFKQGLRQFKGLVDINSVK